MTRTDPIGMSEASTSHFEIVTAIEWLDNEADMEFVTVSTDGTLRRWDANDLSKSTHPIAELKDYDGAHYTGVSLARGDSNKYEVLVGTDQGSVLSFALNGNNAATIFKGHHSPIFSVKRSVTHHTSADPPNNFALLFVFDKNFHKTPNAIDKNIHREHCWPCL